MAKTNFEFQQKKDIRNFLNANCKSICKFQYKILLRCFKNTMFLSIFEECYAILDSLILFNIKLIKSFRL